MKSPLKRNHAATEPLAFDLRTQRVLELRRQIADGTYVIDHALVAAAILREHFAVESAFAPASPTARVATVPSVRDFSRFVVVSEVETTEVEARTATA